MHLINRENNNYVMVAATLFTLAIITSSTMGAAPAAASPTAAPTTIPQPVTATTDNQSVDVLISWEPTIIEPGQDTEFTLDFQDPSSGDSIPHVNYNFEIIDQNNGETVQSMTDLHTHSGTDEHTVAFDTAGSFNLVATIIGTGINPPFDTTQSGTAQTVIPVGRQLAGAAGGNNTTGTTTSSPETGLELSAEPVLRERQITISQTPINQTHILFTDSGNGTITLPNTTEAINFTGTDSVVVSIVDGTAAGKEVFTTLDGSEVVNGTVFAMARFNMEEGTGKAIVTLLLQTNSTGRLAPVNGMILAGHIEFYPDGSAESTMWEWESGVPLPTGTTNATTPTEEPSPLTDTMTTTNATTGAADTNGTTAAQPEEEPGEEVAEQQQQQTTPTTPSNPLFE